MMISNCFGSVSEHWEVSSGRPRPAAIALLMLVLLAISASGMFCAQHSFAVVFDFSG